MIDKDHEKDLISLLETNKDTTESHWVMSLDIINTEALRAMNKFKQTFLADVISTVSPLVANIAAAYAIYNSI